MHLHYIALRSIFDEVMPLVELLYPSLRQDRNSRWSHYLKTWKALALVCHDWHPVAIPYLYRDIVLYRVGQIPALVQTLRINPEFRGMIKRLTFACFVPEGYDLVTNQGLSYLLDHCTALESLTLTWPFTEWLYAVRKDGTKRFAIPPGLWGSVTHFTYYCGDPTILVKRGQTLPSILPLQLLTSLPNISSLTLIVDSSHKYKWDRRSLAFTMMHLQHVRVEVIYPTQAFVKKFNLHKDGIRIKEAIYPLVQKGRVCDLKPVPASLDGLQHVIFHLYNHHTGLNFEPFLDAFRGRIDLWDDSSNFVHVQTYLRSCPFPVSPQNVEQLEHCKSLIRPGDRYAHLRYAHSLLREQHSNSRVRFLDKSLIDRANVPFVFPPGGIDDNDDSVYVYREFGTCILVTARMIVRHEEWTWPGESIIRQELTEEEKQNDNTNALLPFSRLTFIDPEDEPTYNWNYGYIHGCHTTDWDDDNEQDEISSNSTESDSSLDPDEKDDLSKEVLELESGLGNVGDSVPQLTEAEALQIFEDMQR